MNKKSASIAVALSFVFPGLGHAYLGRRRPALAFALPAVVAGIAIGLELLGGLDATLAYVITPSGSMNVLVLLLLTGVWRLIAMVDVALVVRRQSGLRVPAMALTTVLLALVVATHGMGPGSPTTCTTPAPASSSGAVRTARRPRARGIHRRVARASDEFVATPMATPETADSRINILLTGIDSAAGRDHALTDTLLVVSVNPVDDSVVMLSMPRDISNFPLYDGRTFTGKINSLMTWARNHPKDFPDGPFPTLIKELGYLIGVPIHYYAAIDLAGFTRMIDEVGGVTVNNERAINDPQYDWLDGTHGLLPEGGQGDPQRADGARLRALPAGRRRQRLHPGGRQQQLLVALRAKLASPDMIPRLPAILQVAGDTVRTNLPTDRLEEFIALARGVDNSTIKRYVLGPPYSIHPPTRPPGASTRSGS